MNDTWAAEAQIRVIRCIIASLCNEAPASNLYSTPSSNDNRLFSGAGGISKSGVRVRKGEAFSRLWKGVV